LDNNDHVFNPGGDPKYFATCDAKSKKCKTAAVPPSTSVVGDAAADAAKPAVVPNCYVDTGIYRDCYCSVEVNPRPDAVTDPSFVCPPSLQAGTMHRCCFHPPKGNVVVGCQCTVSAGQYGCNADSIEVSDCSVKRVTL
jgi:hypothetical protein